MITPDASQTGGGSSGHSVTPASLCKELISHCDRGLYDGNEGPAAVAMIDGLSNTRPPDALLSNSILANPPRPVIFRALADAYTTHAFHTCPVVDQSDLSNPAILPPLQKAICLAGHLTRHDAGNDPKLLAELYKQAKMLAHIHQDDGHPVQTLQALCLLASCALRPSSPVGIDGPWHWTGVAVRLALQMGLHKESTYRGRADGGCLRRMWWYLHNSDVFLTACWGRPPLLRRTDFDVAPPTQQDFPTPPNAQSLEFIESTKLCLIFTENADLFATRKRSRPPSPDDLLRFETALAGWIDRLPTQLRLYDAEGQRNAFHRPSSELAVQYFVFIILLDFASRRGAPGSNGGGGEQQRQRGTVSPRSLLASSCASTLYEDLLARDEMHALPPATTGFFCLAVALPLIHYAAPSAEREAARKRDLAVVKAVLERLRGRYGDAEMTIGLVDSAAGRRRGGDLQEEESAPPLGSLDLSRLFPFPMSMCDNMDLLTEARPAAAPPPMMNDVAEEEVVAQDWSPMDVADFDFNFMDLFGVDFGGFSDLPAGDATFT